ncbi:unnamed protein product [Acanthoscelides obtectus]|nr:unnamed protein product [Acanthoscelides obtectus]CAK1663998.1 hypothetical protein AOBTE_LOCUS23993 [Acanthoscelides obtectus]
MIIANRPLETLVGAFSQSQSQSQGQSGRPFSKIPPGQYLVASHPWFGTHTHDVTGLADVFNPFKLVEEAAEALVGLFG